MRNIFLIIFILSLLFINTGCGNTSPGDSVIVDPVYDKNVAMTLRVYETDWYTVELSPEYPIDLESMKVLDENKPIDSSQMAIEVGTSLITNLHAQGEFIEYILVGVFHSTEDNVWRFEYSIASKDSIKTSLIVCGSFYVAIDGNDGSIIQAWLDG